MGGGEEEGGEKKKKDDRNWERNRDERVFPTSRLATAQFSVTKFQQRDGNPIETNQRSEFSFSLLPASSSFFFFFILGWRVNPVKLRRRITRNIMPDNRGRRVLVRSDKKRDLLPRGISILHPADLSRKSCVSTGSRMKSSFESISRHFYFRRFVKFDIHSSSCWVDWKMTILR